jgi:hypothetical protein
MEENYFAPSGPRALERYLERMKREMADKQKFRSFPKPPAKSLRLNEF